MRELILILEELSKKYPNDYDLGNKVRHLINSVPFQKEIEEIKKDDVN